MLITKKLILAFIFFTSFTAAIGATKTGIALIIGNDNYASFGALSNPVNDANLLKTTLAKLDFDVMLVTDANQQQMQQAIVNFGEALLSSGSDTVGLFYYAGHGLQIDGRNLLVPVDLNADTHSGVMAATIAVESVLDVMRQAGNNLNFIILDACRNNPFITRNIRRRGSRRSKRGLAKMQAPTGTLIAYSTAPGDVAEDGTGQHSPYAEALAKALLLPNVAVERMFRQVRNQVLHKTQKRQIPWESSSLVGDDYFFNPGVAQPTIANMPASYTDRQALSLHINFLTRPAYGGQFRSFTDGAILRSGNQYQIIVKPAVQGFLYIFQTDAAGKVQRLFPMASYGSHQLGNVNPVQAGTTYTLPKQGKAYTLDNTVGKERFYVFASRNPRPDIENLATRLTNAQATGNTWAEATATTQLNKVFKSRDLPLAPARGLGRTGASNIASFFNNACADCVHVLEFQHQ